MISGYFSATITKLLSPSRRISPIRSFKIPRWKIQGFFSILLIHFSGVFIAFSSCFQEKLFWILGMIFIIVGIMFLPIDKRG